MTRPVNMEITQADLDSLAEKLSEFTDGELAALHFALAAFAEAEGAEVEGFTVDAATPGLFRTLAPARFGEITLKKGILGTPYGGDGITAKGPR